MAVKVTFCPWQIVPVGFCTTVTDGVVTVNTVTVITLDVAVVGLAHNAFDVITTFTWAPLVNAVVLNVGLADGAPCDTLLINHSYVGLAPPLVGVAVKVTLAPGQIAVLGLAAIVTDGTGTGFTV